MQVLSIISEVKLDRMQKKKLDRMLLLTGTTGHGYTAPESVSEQILSQIDKCDVYSFGMVLLHVACTNKKYTILDKMKRCLNIEPNEKPTMGGVEVEYNSWNNKEKKKKIYPFQMFLLQRFQF